MLSFVTAENVRLLGARPCDTQRQPDVRLNALTTAHSDLDAAIGALLQSGISDDLLVTRLKKRKLQIRDAIAGLTMDLAMSLATTGAEPVSRTA